MQYDLELMDADDTCRFFGGSKTINPATLYRGMAAGRYPKPIKVGPGSSRWIKSECVDAMERIIALRDGAEEA